MSGPIELIELAAFASKLRYEHIDSKIAGTFEDWLCLQVLLRDRDLARRTTWRPMQSAPKDGTRILVWFRKHGPVSVTWDDPYGNPRDWSNRIWCVDDFKHGVRPVRGYVEEDCLGWMPLPETDQEKASG